MILLRANNELRTVFGRMLKAMKVNVAWTGNFVVLNNFLILSGSVRSLIFNFDNRKVITNVIELPDREEDMEPVEGNQFLENVLNIALYAFGKWGVIKGIRVEQDYSQLNGLFQTILKDMKITPGFRDDNFRFYKDSVQITYEEVVQAAVEEGKRKAQEAKEEREDAESEERLGLWHNICWEMEQRTFARSELTTYEKQAARLGNNFYRSGFHCPECGEKMFLVVYPEGKEYLVETQEGKVYLARCYTCAQCNSFYTPRPGKLLQEGDAYALKFGSDQTAYEDYQELLGSTGERTTNYHFNEYEWQRGKTKEPESIERACAEMDDMEEEELLLLEEKLESGFYPLKKSQPYLRRIQELLRRKKELRASWNKTHLSDGERESKGHSLETNDQKNSGNTSSNAWKKNQNAMPSFTKDAAPAEKKQDISGKEKKDAEDKTNAAHNKAASSDRGSAEHPQENWVEDKYQARMKTIERMSLRQLQELKKQVQSETRLNAARKSEYSDRIAKAAERKEIEEIRQKAAGCREKPYAFIARAIEEVEKSRAPQQEKSEILKELKELKQRRAEAEAKKLVESAPSSMNHNQYRVFQEKLAQYHDIDIAPYVDALTEKCRQAGKLELDNMMRRVKRSDRKSLLNMQNQLKEGFSEEDAAPMQKEIERRLRELDEAAIDKICPNIMGMTFDEAAEAYEKIEGGAFLPELKTDTLEMIDKRLTKLKMDECALLVEKLKEEMKGRVKNTQRLHYYDVRSVMRGDWEPAEAQLAACALNTYAADRGRYEFPILICDSSGRMTGKEGFLLTPDHIYYNSTFNSEKIPVRAITSIYGNTGILNRGLYLNRGNGAKTKIPGGIPSKELEAFGEVLDHFVSYLQEKPESRSISYLAKAKHDVKCCYRCGFTYQGGNVCPKCGNQANQ